MLPLWLILLCSVGPIGAIIIAFILYKLGRSQHGLIKELGLESPVQRIDLQGNIGSLASSSMTNLRELEKSFSEIVQRYSRQPSSPPKVLIKPCNESQPKLGMNEPPQDLPRCPQRPPRSSRSLLSHEPSDLVEPRLARIESLRRSRSFEELSVRPQSSFTHRDSASIYSMQVQSEPHLHDSLAARSSVRNCAVPTFESSRVISYDGLKRMSSIPEQFHSRSSYRTSQAPHRPHSTIRDSVTFPQNRATYIVDLYQQYESELYAPEDYYDAYFEETNSVYDDYYRPESKRLTTISEESDRSKSSRSSRSRLKFASRYRWPDQMTGITEDELEEELPPPKPSFARPGHEKQASIDSIQSSLYDYV